MDSQASHKSSSVVVVGGGLAGLTAATLLARAGVKTILLEHASEVGGLARTRNHQGFYFNLGPHALYRAGHARRIFTALGIQYKAGQPAGDGLAVYQGKAARLPANLLSLLACGILSPGDKWRLAQLMARLGSIETGPLKAIDVETWIVQNKLRPRVAALLRAFVCLATYCADTNHLSAGVGLEQLKLAVRSGVDYIDGGWQTLVDGLAEAARSAGVELRNGAKIARVNLEGNEVTGLTLADGETLSARAVILACGPESAARLIDGPASAAICAWRDGARPARVATLDVALRVLPSSRPTFALGIDDLWYYSVHSSVARLAPKSGALIHVMRYLRSNEATEAGQLEAQLMAVLDRFQPGWREQIVHKQFLPALQVCHDVPRARADGLAGRMPSRVPGMQGLFVAGDWVGGRGHLADAAVASAEEAASEILASRAGRQDFQSALSNGCKIDVA